MFEAASKITLVEAIFDRFFQMIGVTVILQSHMVAQQLHAATISLPTVSIELLHQFGCFAAPLLRLQCPS